MTAIYEAYPDNEAVERSLSETGTLETNERFKFRKGDRVKVSNLEGSGLENFSEFYFGKVGTVVKVEDECPEGFYYKVKFIGFLSAMWFGDEHLESETEEMGATKVEVPE